MDTNFDSLSIDVQYHTEFIVSISRFFSFSNKHISINIYSFYIISFLWQKFTFVIGLLKPYM